MMALKETLILSIRRNDGRAHLIRPDDVCVARARLLVSSSHQEGRKKKKSLVRQLKDLLLYPPLAEIKKKEEKEKV